MRKFSYPASFEPDEDGRVVVSFVDFPYAHTDGKDAAEAMEEAIDCLGSVIAQQMAEKLDIPAPSRVGRGQQLVPVPFWIAGKLALYLAVREKGVSNTDLARRLGVRDNRRAPNARSRSRHPFGKAPGRSGRPWQACRRDRGRCRLRQVGFADIFDLRFTICCGKMWSGEREFE